MTSGTIAAELDHGHLVRRLFRGLLQPRPQRPTSARAGHPGGRRGRRRLGWRAQVAHPVEHGRGDVGVLHHQVTGGGEAVDLGAGQASPQVGQVHVGEDGVEPAPQHQGGDVGHGGQVGLQAHQVRPTGMAQIKGDVAHEIADGPTVGGVGVGGTEGPSDRPRQLGVGKDEGAVDEGRGAHAEQIEQAPGAHDADEGGRGRARRLVHSGVGEHDAGQLVTVAHGPTQRDGPAPVVGHGDHGTVHTQGVGQRAEVVDALGERARRGEALGEAHAQLVHGHHPHPRGAAASRRRHR